MALQKRLRSLARFLGLASLCLAALLDPAPALAAQTSAYALPPAIPLETAPAPAPDLPPPEYSRRAIEVTPELALARPSCTDGSWAESPCDGLGLGLGFGLTALWRPSPFFAVGGTGNLVTFAPDTSSTRRETSASTTFFGLLARVYFSDHGAAEPYLELGLGAGASRNAQVDAAGVRYSESADGAAARAGVGIEFYLSRHLRLGPAFEWNWLHASRLERCESGGPCRQLTLDQTAHGSGFTSFSLRLALLFGQDS